MKDFKELTVWKKSMQLTMKIYHLTDLLPKSEMFGLSSQMRRAAVSVPSNIAEGYGRSSKVAYLNFLKIARGSLYELETQLWICRSLGYLRKEDSVSVFLLLQEVSKMLYCLIRSVDASN